MLFCFFLSFVITFLFTFSFYRFLPFFSFSLPPTSSSLSSSCFENGYSDFSIFFPIFFSLIYFLLSFFKFFCIFPFNFYHSIFRNLLPNSSFFFTNTPFLFLLSTSTYSVFLSTGFQGWRSFLNKFLQSLIHYRLLLSCTSYFSSLLYLIYFYFIYIGCTLCLVLFHLLQPPLNLPNKSKPHLLIQ